MNQEECVRTKTVDAITKNEIMDQAHNSDRPRILSAIDILKSSRYGLSDSIPWTSSCYTEKQKMTALRLITASCLDPILTNLLASIVFNERFNFKYEPVYSRHLWFIDYRERFCKSTEHSFYLGG